MESKNRRLVKIGCIQILVLRLLYETVIRHIDPVNTTLSSGILQNGVYQTIGITGTLHIHQLHPRLETEQTVLRVSHGSQSLHGIGNITILPSHETLVVHVIKQSRFPVTQAGHAHTHVRGYPVLRSFPSFRRVDRVLESGPTIIQYLCVGISGIRHAKAGQRTRVTRVIYRLIAYDILSFRGKDKIDKPDLP